MLRSVLNADDQVRLVMLKSNEQAWQSLPKPLVGAGAPLPTWARMLAPRLPLTTATLLELDLAQRTKSPMASDLRAVKRYEIAEANGCDYAR